MAATALAEGDNTGFYGDLVKALIPDLPKVPEYTGELAGSMDAVIKSAKELTRDVFVYGDYQELLDSLLALFHSVFKQLIGPSLSEMLDDSFEYVNALDVIDANLGTSLSKYYETRIAIGL